MCPAFSLSPSEFPNHPYSPDLASSVGLMRYLFIESWCIEASLPKFERIHDQDPSMLSDAAMDDFPVNICGSPSFNLEPRKLDFPAKI
jgi:hypothetical protein